ncbi:MAG: DnaT-like ssDNA-binding domain-containing protein [Pseudomonas helleri]
MDWLRLWHDMPNDPKWRTISRVSTRTIPEVMAVYCYLLVMASSNPDRGHIEGITCHDMSRENVTNVTCHEINFIEGLSTALDIDIEHIEAILAAMQGRVLSGSKMSGWDGRQPKREDAGGNESGAKSAAQRKREERERKKAEAQNAGCHDASRSVTQSHDREEERRLDTTPPLLYASDISDSRTKFSMTKDWLPCEKSFGAVLTMNAMAGQTLQADQLLEFKSFWIASPDEHRTHAKWEHALAQHLKRDLRHQQAAGRTNDGRHNNTGSRSARQGPRSAVDRVKQHIADREAREAAASAIGQAVGEDDRDVRPPLDGEFRRES